MTNQEAIAKRLWEFDYGSFARWEEAKNGSKRLYLEAAEVILEALKDNNAFCSAHSLGRDCCLDN